MTEISIFFFDQIFLTEFLTEFLTKYKVWTLQLYNPLEVDAEWNYQKPADKRLELDKHMPLHLRRKMRKQQKPAPLVFDVMPANGCLRPKERQNIQIRFLPSGDEHYKENLVLMVSDSTKRLTIDVNGMGLEPKVEITPNMVELGPILPFRAVFELFYHYVMDVT